MSQFLGFDHLCGTEITLDQPFLSPPRTIVLDEKISEDSQTTTQRGYNQGLGAPFAVIKFSCHGLLDPGQQGFMRIYLQIPVDGTFLRAPEVRAKQAIRQRTHTELTALATLDREDCTVVPKLLGYTERLQRTEDLVPGESVDYDSFWKRDLEYRQQLRSAFRTAYELTLPSKLIYDDVTKAIHISGFRGAIPVDTEPFSDETYALWGLAKPSDRLDWYLDSSDWSW